MLPIVKEEIIDSLWEQFQKQGVEYTLDILEDMEKENPNLTEAIRNTIDHAANIIGKSEQQVTDIANNMCLLAASVYNALKQQSICDEL
jgi:hypothetical protein